MEIRLTKPEEVEAVLQIIQFGREIQSKHGNEGQWPDFYPAAEHILHDIERGESFVCVTNHEDETDLPLGTIIATLCIQKGEEKTYREIEGQWLKPGPYVTIHRIASSQKLSGIGSFCLQFVINQHDNIRIDTHVKNKSMLRLIEKFGFQYCGVIEVRPNEKRVAFQYVKENEFV